MYSPDDSPLLDQARPPEAKLSPRSITLRAATAIHPPELLSGIRGGTTGQIMPTSAIGPPAAERSGRPAIVRSMETQDAITSRRNVRAFADRPIRAEDLDQILEAGRRSPSSQNWQPWDFVLVTDRAQLQDLSQVFYGAHHVANSAATIAIIAPADDNEFHRAQFDLGQATMSMALAAADLGIGSCHAGVADLDLARRVLGLPGDRNWVLLLSLGYPADRPLAPVRKPKRRPFDEVVHRGRW